MIAAQQMSAENNCPTANPMLQTPDYSQRQGRLAMSPLGNPLVHEHGLHMGVSSTQLTSYAGTRGWNTYAYALATKHSIIFGHNIRTQVLAW